MSRYRYVNQRTSKVNCSYDMFRASTFCARCKSLRACYAHAYECASNFLRPVFVLCHGPPQVMISVELQLGLGWCEVV